MRSLGVVNRRASPPDAKLVAAADISTIASPFPGAGTVIDYRASDKRIGAGGTADLSVALLHSWGVIQDSAYLDPATGPRLIGSSVVTLAPVAPS
jgi:hypothetical protein